MCFIARFAKFSCFSGTILIGLVLWFRIIQRKPSVFGFPFEEDSIKETSYEIYYVYESNLCFMTTMSIVALVFKWSPDMKKWIAQQTVDFVCYFAINFLFNGDYHFEYRDLVVQSAFLYVIRLWILFLIWTCQSGTKKDKTLEKKQDLDKLLETFDLRHEEEGRFLV